MLLSHTHGHVCTRSRISFQNNLFLDLHLHFAYLFSFTHKQIHKTGSIYNPMAVKDTGKGHLMPVGRSHGQFKQKSYVSPVFPDDPSSTGRLPDMCKNLINPYLMKGDRVYLGH